MDAAAAAEAARGAARAGARAPYSPRDCLRTEGRRGLKRPDLSPGRVPGRRADTPRPRLLSRAYRALVPQAAAASSPGHATTPLPRPQRLPGPGFTAPGLHPPSRRLPRTTRSRAPAAGARGAGRMHGRRRGRRKEAAARPGPAPAEARLAPSPWRLRDLVPGAQLRSPGLAGRGGGRKRRESGLRRSRPQSAL